MYRASSSVYVLASQAVKIASVVAGVAVYHNVDLVNSKMASLETLNFDNLVLRSLPIDTIDDNYVRQVSAACFSRVKPTPVVAPETVVYSADAMGLLDLPDGELRRPDFASYFSGTKLLPGSQPAAHCYCGHQFGYFSGQLGDGAAIYLGEVVNAKGERWEVQLKGAGKTPYSRTADGRKVLRSSIREFLCSEAMYYLGVPTTRAGACVTSKTGVVRDIFYNGNSITEKATVVTRIAPSFIRFGSFEIFKTRDPMSGRTGPSVGRHEIRLQMLDYCISTLYPEIYEAHKDNLVARYRSFYREVVLRTAKLVSDWQTVGFCHGVLNTDNMSILGLTIDYGPFGFIDRYNPDHVCNASDDGRRYTYRKQPEICRWNLLKLAEALNPALPIDQSMKELELYEREFKRCYLETMRKKLGLVAKELPEDELLAQKFLDTLEETGGDFTNSFRGLSLLQLPGAANHADSVTYVRKHLLRQCCSSADLKRGCGPGMDEGQFQLMMMLKASQPEMLAQLMRDNTALDRELKRRENADRLKSLTDDQKAKTDADKWDSWLQLYVERLRTECDGRADVERLNRERVQVMNATNPRFVLRNYIAQNAIVAAEGGDYSEVRKLLKVLRTPFSETKGDVQMAVHPSVDVPDEAAAQSQQCFSLKYDSRPPDWAQGLRVT